MSNCRTTPITRLIPVNQGDISTSTSCLTGGGKYEVVKDQPVAIDLSGALDSLILRVTAGDGAATVLSGPVVVGNDDFIHFWGESINFVVTPGSARVQGEVKISADAGNSILLGSDGGILVNSIADIYVDGAAFDVPTAILTLTDNSGSTPDIAIDLSTLLSTVISNGDGTYTHDGGNGTTTLIDTRDGISADAGNLLSLGTDSRPILTQATIVGNETTSPMVDNGDGTYTYTDEDGVITTIDIKDGVSADAGNSLSLGADGLPYFGAITETVTTILDNGDGTFTYTNEDATAVTFDAHTDANRAWGTSDTQRTNADDVLVTDSIFHTGLVAIGMVDSARIANTALSVSNSTTIGAGHTVSGVFHLIAGSTNNVSGGYHGVFGTNNTVSSYQSVVTGDHNANSGQHNFVGGSYNSQAGGTSVVVGRTNTVSVLDSLVAGQGNGLTNVVRSVVVGESNTVPASANSIAILGRNNVVDGQTSGAFTGQGHNVTGSGVGNLVAGINSIVSGTTMIVAGEANTASAASGLLVGQANALSGHNTIAGGTSNANISASNSVVTGSNHVSVAGNQLLVAGDKHTTNASMSIVAGYQNNESGNYGIVTGLNNNVTGNVNAVFGQASTVSGSGNVVGGASLTVAGSNNVVIGSSNSVTGGNSVVGGYNNTNMGMQMSLVVGQAHAYVSGSRSIVGGYNHVLATSDSLVVGTTQNVSGGGVSVSGIANTVTGQNGSVTGNGNNVSGSGGVIGGYGNTVSGSSNMVVGSGNNVGGTFNIVGGDSNTIASNASLVIGGAITVDVASGNSIVGGQTHSFTNSPRNLVGGDANTLTNTFESIVAGGSLQVTSPRSTVSGVSHNVTGVYSAVFGQGHTVNATHATAFGFEHNITGNFGFASGRAASITHTGATIIKDASATVVASAIADEIVLKGNGGIRIYTNDSQTTGVTMASGTSAWVAVSDSRTKRKVSDADGNDVLNRLRNLGVHRFAFKSDPTEAVNIGLFADEFNAAFDGVITPKRVGEMHGLSQQDVDGVLVSAVKALLARLEKVEATLHAAGLPLAI